MRKSPLFALLLFLFWMTWPQPVTAQEASPTPETLTPTLEGSGLGGNLPPVSPGISDPPEEGLLSGVVAISGYAPGRWDLSFSYQDDPTGTWFFLAASPEPGSGILLPAWDTTAITDGLYTLRLRIFSAEAAQEFMVDIRILNYSALETPTPLFTPTTTSTFTPPLPTPLPTFTPTVTFTPALLPTPLPPNPAVLQPQAIAIRFGQGALGVTTVFACLGLLLTIRKKLRS